MPTQVIIVPGTQQGGHSEDNEAHVTDETNRNNDSNSNDEGGDASMNNDINPNDKGNDELREMMKGTINGVSNPRVQAQLQQVPGLKLALLLGLRIDSEKNLQRSCSVLLFPFYQGTNIGLYYSHKLSNF